MKPKILTIVCLFMVIVTALAGCSGETPSPGTLTTTPTGAAPTISTPTPIPVAETLEEILGRGSKLTNFTFTLTGTIPDMPAETKMWIRGLKARIDATADGQPVILIFDTAAKVLYTYTPSLKVAEKESLADNDLIANFNPGKIAGEILRQKPTVVGTETLDGKATLKIQGTGDNGEKYNAWISKETGIPLKLASAEPGNNLMIEWKNVDLSTIPDSVFEIPIGVQIILPDTTPPAVVSTSPAQNAASVMVNIPITATFSEEMKVTAETQTSFILKSNDKAVSGNVTYKGNTVTFTPTGELAYSTTYTVTVTKQAKDLAGNGLSADYSWNFKTRDAGVLEGALNYVGAYPKPALVTYRDKSNKEVSVTAYPGQVQVYYDSKSAASEVEAMLVSKGGTIIGKIPLMGYYLVQVAEGKEAAFIASLQTDAKLKMAIPNIALSLESDGVVINEDFVNQRIPTPLNITGPVIVDAGDHADELLEAARELGGDIKNLVEISDVSDGYFGADKVTLTLAAIAQGSKIFDPGKPVYINLSDGAGAQVNGKWVDYNILGDSGKQAAMSSWKDAVSGKLQTLESMPADLSSQLVISQSAGNSNMPIGQPLQEIRNEHPELGLVLRDNFTLCSTDLSPAGIDRSRYPSGKIANSAPGDKDVVKINNPQVSFGTSFLAVVSLAYTIQAAKEAGGLSAAHVNLAIKMAALQNSIVNKDLTLADSIKATQKVASIANSLRSTGKATEEQITKAMWLSMTLNAYRDLVPEEVFSTLETISSLTATDPTAAMWVTSIKITSADSFVSAVITPAIPGVTVQYIVTGKSPVTGKINTYSGSKKTDASGRVSFNVPPGECEEVYTYKVTAVLSGKTDTKQYMFYYD